MPAMTSSPSATCSAAHSRAMHVWSLLVDDTCTLPRQRKARRDTTPGGMRWQEFRERSRTIRR
jgi:hypothetical protein